MHSADIFEEWFAVTRSKFSLHFNCNFLCQLYQCLSGGFLLIASIHHSLKEIIQLDWKKLVGWIKELVHFNVEAIWQLVILERMGQDHSISTSERQWLTVAHNRMGRRLPEQLSQYWICHYHPWCHLYLCVQHDPSQMIERAELMLVLTIASLISHTCLSSSLIAIILGLIKH